MKKVTQLFAIVAILFSTIVSAQPNTVKSADYALPDQKAQGFKPHKCDTVVIHDTVSVAVYLVDITDTVPATITYELKKGKGHVRIAKGYALVRGFKVFDKQPKWVTKPEIIGALDSKKRILHNVIQIF